MITFARLHGCLVGGALGDALGYPLEFEKPASVIAEKFGTAPPKDMPGRATADALAVVSDDTQMTLFSAEAILRARGAHSDAWPSFALGAYQRWHTTQALRPGARVTAPLGRGLLCAESRMYARRAPGNTCLAALARSYMVDEVGSVANPPNDSKGCGAIMRSAPFGLASLVFDLARGGPLCDAMHAADALLAGERGHEEVANAVAAARALCEAERPLSVDDVESLGGGWVGEETLAIAIACALGVARASEDAIAHSLWRSVAHAGDSDSTGAVTGNLLGAMYGIEALPSRWLAQLELRDVIERIARDLYDTVVHGVSPDPEAYPPHDGRFVPLSNAR